MSNDTREALAAAAEAAREAARHHVGEVRERYLTLAGKLAALTEQPSDTKIRRMLCAMYAGSAAYMDDGEAQDNRAYPLIDFLRDTADEIASKMRERAQGALTEQPAAPRGEWSSVRSEIRAAHGAAPQAQAGPQVCKHGIRSPHECKDCADAASAEDIAAWIAAPAQEPQQPAKGERELIRETEGGGVVSDQPDGLPIVACEVTHPGGSQELFYAGWLTRASGRAVAHLPRRELVYLSDAEAEIDRLRAELAAQAASSPAPTQEPQQKTDLTELLREASDCAFDAGNRELADRLNDAMVAQSVASSPAPAVQPEAVAELVKALGELLATVDSPFPPLEEGRLEQEMWADRRTKARKRARTLIAKHGQPQGGKEAAQRERMAEKFANRATTQATADFDLPARSDVVQPQGGSNG